MPPAAGASGVTLVRYNAAVNRYAAMIPQSGAVMIAESQA